MISVNWKPDKDSEITITNQIVEYFKEKILSGKWTVGSLIPNQRLLAEKFGVNRSTISSAMSELKSDGFITSNGKSGTKVANGMLNYLASYQPDWNGYIDYGIHAPNYKTIKTINDTEFNSDYIRLSSGEASPELFPVELLKEVVADVAKDINALGYECPNGSLYLREQLSIYLKKQGIDAKPESILIVSGALQAIQLISMGLLQSGSTVFIEKPSYLYSLQILKTLGMRKCGIEMDEEGIIASKIPHNIRKNKLSLLYTIPNFQNPTGILMSNERRNELLKICQESKIPIVEDDVYRELWIDEEPIHSLKSLDVSGNVIYIGSVSKSLSPGLRIGWVVAPEPVINRLSDIKMQMDYGSSSLSQLVVAKFLEMGYYDAHMESMRNKLRKRRDKALDLLDTYFKELADWDKPKGGFYIWIKLRKKISMTKLFEDACNEGILLYPGYLYESSSNDYLRISYSYASDDEMDKGIKALSAIVRRHYEDEMHQIKYNY